MAEQTVSFKFKNGHVGVLSLSVAETLEGRKDGAIVKEKPEPVKEPAKKDSDK